MKISKDALTKDSPNSDLVRQNNFINETQTFHLKMILELFSLFSKCLTGLFSAKGALICGFLPAKAYKDERGSCLVL